MGRIGPNANALDERSESQDAFVGSRALRGAESHERSFHSLARLQSHRTGSMGGCGSDQRGSMLGQASVAPGPVCRQ